MSDKTIFARIIDREIPANIIYEDQHCLAFHDIQPQAPIHVLIIPKLAIASLKEVTREHQELLGHMMTVIPRVAAQLGLANGYRLIANCGVDGGQTVSHLHFHLLGGRSLAWPPG